MEGGVLTERTLRRLPFALAGVCLVTGALGLAMTFSGRTVLVPFQPVDYSVLVQAPETTGFSSEAPGPRLDGLSPEPLYVADLVEEPAAPTAALPAARTPSPAPAIIPSDRLVTVPVLPTTAPAPDPGDADAVADSEPPPVPVSAAAVPSSGANDSAPSSLVVATGTGESLPAYNSRPGTNVGATPTVSSTPTATPTQKPKPTATPTATPTKANGNGNANGNTNSNPNSNSKKK